MTPLETLAKNPSDKIVNLTSRDRTPKKAQDTQRLVCCLPGGLKQKAHSFDVHLIGLNRLHDILSAKMKTILF